MISNASDACDKLRYNKIANPELTSENHEFKIDIKLTEDSIIITDNGIGMDKDDLIANLGTIARSGTQNFMENLDKSKDAVELIGQFGVGFYSAFLVADTVKVISTKAGTDKSFVWESEGKGEYSISEHGTVEATGTSIHLHIKPEAVEFLEKFKVQHIVTTYSDHISFPITLTDKEENTETINQSSAIWTRSKSEITEEQYKEFYSHIAHSPDQPWMTLHNKAEGTLEYTNLLYIPSQAPFDLYHPDRMSRIKLYVKRVFITDNAVELIPAYLRFMRGIIDSSDLPLNISRETLQHNATIMKIKKSVVKKILSSLKKKAKNDNEEYTKFWNNFGAVIKEGLCEGALEEKEDLLEVCKFQTNKSDGKLVSLEDYVANMSEEQKHIFYLTGDSIDALKKSPQLEGFAKRDIEVLLLPDNVDDFWVNVVHQYKTTELKSVMSSDINLDDIKSLEENSTQDSSTDKNTDSKQIIEYFKEVLGETVRDVKTTSKLIDFPASLAVAEGSMNARMEKYLMEQNQLASRSSKILELNLKHPLIKQIDNAIANKTTNEDTKNMVNIIFNQACLIVGEPISEYDYG